MHSNERDFYVFIPENAIGDVNIPQGTSVEVWMKPWGVDRKLLDTFEAADEPLTVSEATLRSSYAKLISDCKGHFRK